MIPIKAFIYLDTEKMFSVSSQIFEGLTEYIINSKNKSTEDKTSQKGELFSGKVLADIIEESTGTTEKKFLHDYAFNLFEEKLRKNNKILDINNETILDSIEKIDEYSFVAIKGRVIFNDFKTLVNTSDNFNDLGYHTGILTGLSDLKTELDKLSEKVNRLRDRNQKVKNEELIKHRFDVKKILLDEGLQMNEHFLKAVSYIVKYGYSDQFEIQLPFFDNEYNYLFSCIVNREMLKESETTIVHKYSRESEKDFIIFGIPTQTLKLSEKIKSYASSITDDNDITMKEALTRLTRQLGSLERTFTGKLDYEYIIDPIAVYREI